MADEDLPSTEGSHSYKIIGHLGKILARNTAAKKEESKELEKDLQLLSPAEADALVEAGTLELLLRYLTVEPHFDVVTKCLIALSSYDSGRAALYDMNENGMAWLAEYMINQAKTAKAEKPIEKATVLAKILVLYSIDAPGSQLTWLNDLCELLVGALQRSQTKTGMQESYTYLSIILPSMWVSMGSSLAPVIAAAVITAGGMPLLFKVAKEVQRSDIKGLPKIIAEKALNLVCACNAEQPAMSIAQVPAKDLAAFCIDTTTKSDWVQSQELSLVLLGRLVYVQHALPESYMNSKAVGTVLHHAMKTKSPALRMTAFCLSLICPEAVFEAVCVEANEVIMDLAEGSYQSIKRLTTPTAGGMTILHWGYPLNKFAQDLLRASKLLTRMAETLPLHLPAQLVELLPADLKQYVTGIKAAHGVRGSPSRNPKIADDGEVEDDEARDDLADATVKGSAGGAGPGAKPSKRLRQAQGSDSESYGPSADAGKRHKVQPSAAAGPSKASAAASQPTSQPQQSQPAARGGTSSSTAGFTSNDYSQLNGAAFELVMASSQLDEKAHQVLDLLMQGIKTLPQVLDLKYRLPAAAAAECDHTLRQWANRVRQMLGDLSEAKGSKLDMLLSFSNVMLEEITCCAKDMQHQVAQANA